jgi:hypothetical protein
VWTLGASRIQDGESDGLRRWTSVLGTIEMAVGQGIPERFPHSWIRLFERMNKVPQENYTTAANVFDGWVMTC